MKLYANVLKRGSLEVWLNVYQNGYLHRDISIGNVLAFEQPEKRNTFKWNDEFVASLGEVTTEMLHQKLRKLGYKVKLDVVRIPDAKALMKELSVLLDKFGIGGSCEAFVIDCDLAKDWRKLFACWKNDKVSSQRERSASSAKLELSKYC